MTAGQLLVSLSGLSGVSAGAHLMAITAGAGATIYAQHMSVTTTTERFTVSQKPRKQAQSVRPAIQQVTQRQTQQTAEPRLTIAQVNIYTATPSVRITTQTDEWWILMNKETF